MGRAGREHTVLAEAGMAAHTDGACYCHMQAGAYAPRRTDPAGLRNRGHARPALRGGDIPAARAVAAGGAAAVASARTAQGPGCGNRYVAVTAQAVRRGL